MKTITFGDLSFEIRHSSKRRTVGITVERDGKLILASPPEVPIETLEKIVSDKRFWIYSKLLKQESLNPPVNVKQFVSGEAFYYLGLSYRLKIVEEAQTQALLRLFQSRFELQQQAQAQGREHFIQWYRQHLQVILEQQITALIKRVTTSPRSIQVRELGNHWAACGHKGDLYFHWRVAMLPRTMIEYLAVHELVHLIEPNHSAEFWHRLERIMPDYLERKQWLAENGAIYNL
ncbi:M48 family metallopeptidase [Calothrix sp. FACHB-1219]|uniref:M48 family metallopeptidase n=1 Tax=unclassified Calothrix TaxID=2619626 RepID=UPI001687D8D8|nr:MULTISPECIES: SprT family zinc-dependent metalloprotease [unclassified Calothrix]MBD2205277.1 M48 family metallopeptidase [Calothrix sp. FACHB-168]MBD2220050.1 M48 family metallopeptidase [Calothrix sp. FACHB-1219]